jgi:hypothetical protein
MKEGFMRRIRVAAVMASIGIGLLAGPVPPAQAATLPDLKGAVGTNYQFGYYYYEWACRYFGDSLVQGGAFSSYSCYYQYYQPDNAYYWFLYVY